MIIKLNSIASSQSKLDEIYPKEGWVELDPNQIIKASYIQSKML